MITGSWIDAVVAANAGTSGEVDLGRQYERMLLVIPALVPNSAITIEVAEKASGDFQEVYITDPASGGDKKIISANSAGVTTWVVPMGGFQFIKVKCATNQTSESTFRVCGVRS